MAILKFSVNIEPGSLHFNFARDLANYISGCVKLCVWLYFHVILCLYYSKIPGQGGCFSGSSVVFKCCSQDNTLKILSYTLKTLFYNFKISSNIIFYWFRNHLPFSRKQYTLTVHMEYLTMIEEIFNFVLKRKMYLVIERNTVH